MLFLSSIYGWIVTAYRSNCRMLIFGILYIFVILWKADKPSWGRCSAKMRNVHILILIIILGPGPKKPLFCWKALGPNPFLITRYTSLVSIASVINFAGLVFWKIENWPRRGLKFIPVLTIINARQEKQTCTLSVT